MARPDKLQVRGQGRTRQAEELYDNNAAASKFRALCSHLAVERGYARRVQKPIGRLLPAHAAENAFHLGGWPLMLPESMTEPDQSPGGMS